MGPQVEARLEYCTQVHAYVHVPGGRTAYLSELCSGSEVVVVDAAGGQRSAIVGRVKIEKRPLVRPHGFITVSVIECVFMLSSLVCKLVHQMYYM